MARRDMTDSRGLGVRGEERGWGTESEESYERGSSDDEEDSG